MPPHCDALDGPVVKAARKALEAGDVDLVLRFVKADGEEEVRTAFVQVMRARHEPDAVAVADRYFFETVVRIHRRGEGAPYTGLKPVGLDVGPAIPLAERAIETGSGDELAALLTDLLQEEVKARLDAVLALQRYADAPVPKAREYVEAMLGFQVWSNAVVQAIGAPAHAEQEGPTEAEHRH